MAIKWNGTNKGSQEIRLDFGLLPEAVAGFKAVHRKGRSRSSRRRSQCFEMTQRME